MGIVAALIEIAIFYASLMPFRARLGKWMGQFDPGLGPKSLFIISRPPSLTRFDGV